MRFIKWSESLFRILWQPYSLSFQAQPEGLLLVSLHQYLEYPSVVSARAAAPIGIDADRAGLTRIRLLGAASSDPAGAATNRFFEA